MNNLDNEERIYIYIKNNPGAHLRRISKELGIALGGIQYQLKQLEATLGVEFTIMSANS